MTAMAMFEDEFRTDMEEEQAERLVSEATAADALMTWGLEVTLVSLSPARASWILCTALSAPKEGRGGPAQGRGGPLQSSVSKPLAWTRRRCDRQPGSGHFLDGAGGGGHGSRRLGRWRLPLEDARPASAEETQQKMTTQSKKMRDGKVFHVNGNDQNRSCSAQTKWAVKHRVKAVEGPHTVIRDQHIHQRARLPTEQAPQGHRC